MTTNAKKFKTRSPREQLMASKCVLSRVPAGEGSEAETACMQFIVDGWSERLTVDLGESVENFAPGTPWKDVFSLPVETYMFFLGERFKLVTRYVKGGYVKVEIHETFTGNVASGVGVRKKPFVIHQVDVRKPKKEPAKKYLYSASVATFDANSDMLTTFCQPFTTAEAAVDWVEGDWNDQADVAEGEYLDATQRKRLMADLEKDGFADLECPSDWPEWHVWKIVRTTI